jgi:hypothetical protein
VSNALPAGDEDTRQVPSCLLGRAFVPASSQAMVIRERHRGGVSCGPPELDHSQEQVVSHRSCNPCALGLIALAAA